MTETVTAASPPIAPGQLATLRQIVRDVWDARELFVQLTRRDLKLRYRQAAMGFLWAIFLPVLTITAGLIVRFIFVRGGGTVGAPSIGGIAIKSWAWAFFAGAMNFATISILSNAALVTKIYFPREVLPLASIVAQGVDSILGFLILALAGALLKFHWSVELAWLPLLVVALVLVTTGLGFLFACANLFYRDVKYILQVLLTFGIFYTPVIFEPAMFGRFAPVMMLNPLSAILVGLQMTMVEQRSLFEVIRSPAGTLLWTPWYLVYSVLAGCVLTVGGMLAFRRGAAYFAEYY